MARLNPRNQAPSARLAALALLHGVLDRRLPLDEAFEDAQAAFDRVIPHQTSVEDLRQMGFDPARTPNVRILTYLDLINRFLPNSLILAGGATIVCTSFAVLGGYALSRFRFPGRRSLMFAILFTRVIPTASTIAQFTVSSYIPIE